MFVTLIRRHRRDSSFAFINLGGMWDGKHIVGTGPASLIYSDLQSLLVCSAANKAALCEPVEKSRNGHLLVGVGICNIGS